MRRRIIFRIIFGKIKQKAPKIFKKICFIAIYITIVICEGFLANYVHKIRKQRREAREYRIWIERKEQERRQNNTKYDDYLRRKTWKHRGNQYYDKI
jgi:hypothetical protein